jgi:hypothetical protein
MLGRILPAISIASLAVAQAKQLSVCEALSVAIDHQEVGGEPHHGFLLFEALNSDPCPDWRKSLFSAPSIIGLVFRSDLGVQLTKEQERSNFEFLKRLHALYNRSGPVNSSIVIKGCSSRNRGHSFSGDGTESTSARRSDPTVEFWQSLSSRRFLASLDSDAGLHSLNNLLIAHDQHAVH